MNLPDGLHIGTVASVWVGRTVGGVPVTRLRISFADEADVLQRTLAGREADLVFGAYDVRDPRELQDTRWIVEVKGHSVNIVRPA